MASWRSVVGVLLLVVNTSVVVAAGGSGLPQIKSRVNDHAAVLNNSQMHQLYQISAQHQFSNHNHVVVVTASSSGSESAQVYAEHIWQQWKPIKKSRSVMLLLVKQPQGAAIIAGDAFDKELNVAAIKKIIYEKITTSLIKGDYDGAAMEGLQGILGELDR